MLNFEKTQRVTSKGQITLPVAWRKMIRGNHVIVYPRGNTLEIREARLAEDGGNEYTGFDAIRDNKGKGIKARDLVRILKKIDG